MARYPNIERLYARYIAESEARGNKWYITDALNSDMLPSGMGAGVVAGIASTGPLASVSAFNAIRAAGTGINTALATRPVATTPRFNFSEAVGSIAGLLGVAAQSYAVIQASKNANKNPEQAAAILQGQGIAVPPGQAQELYVAAEADRQNNTTKYLLFGGIGLAAVLLLTRK